MNSNILEALVVMSKSHNFGSAFTVFENFNSRRCTLDINCVILHYCSLPLSTSALRLQIEWKWDSFSSWYGAPINSMLAAGLSGMLTRHRSLTDGFGPTIFISDLKWSLSFFDRRNVNKEITEHALIFIRENVRRSSFLNMVPVKQYRKQFKDACKTSPRFAIEYVSLTIPHVWVALSSLFPKFCK